MNKTLFIDTSDKEKTFVALKIGKKTIKKSAKRKLNSQIVLMLIDKLLKENKMKISDIDGIEVFRGPGSFTGLKVGITVGNTIAAALGVKINGKRQIVDAKYK